MKYVAKSTIVANIHTWRFCVEKLQNEEIMINVTQRHGIAWYEAEGQAKWLREHVPEVDNAPMTTSHVVPNTLTQNYTL